MPIYSPFTTTASYTKGEKQLGEAPCFFIMHFPTSPSVKWSSQSPPSITLTRNNSLTHNNIKRQLNVYHDGLSSRILVSAVVFLILLSEWRTMAVWEIQWETCWLVRSENFFNNGLHTYLSLDADDAFFLSGQSLQDVGMLRLPISVNSCQPLIICPITATLLQIWLNNMIYCIHICKPCILHILTVQLFFLCTNPYYYTPCLYHIYGWSYSVQFS